MENLKVGDILVGTGELSSPYFFEVLKVTAKSVKVKRLKRETFSTPCIMGKEMWATPANPLQWDEREFEGVARPREYGMSLKAEYGATILLEKWDGIPVYVR